MQPYRDVMTEAAASTKADYAYSKDPTNNRYVAHYDGEIVGFASYRELGDGVHFDHTVVDQAHQGRGVASQLIRYAMDDFDRVSRLPVVPVCSYVDAWLSNHPEYQHLKQAR